MYALAIASCLVSMPAAADQVFVVDGKVTIRAENRALSAVLADLNEQVRFRLIEHVDTGERLVAVDIREQPWDKALEKLLSGWGYSLTMDSERGQPKQLVILSRDPNAAAVRDGPENTLPEDGRDRTDSGETDGAATEAAPDEIEARIREAAGSLLGPRDPALEVIGAVQVARDALREAELVGGERAADGDVNRPSESVLQAKDVYLGALADLGDYDDPRVVDALLPTLDSDDPEVQLAALESMRWLSHARLNVAAVSRAHAIVLSTSDPAVQRAGLEVLARYGDGAEVLAVVEPLALNPGPNQDLAARTWLRIREEQQARRNAEHGSARDNRDDDR